MCDDTPSFNDSEQPELSDATHSSVDGFHISDDPAAAKGWRVKLYHLDDQGAWKDKGTGFVSVEYDSFDTIVVRDEDEGELLLRSKISTSDIYEKQNENIIMWKEEDSVDVALSFQEEESLMRSCSESLEAGKRAIPVFVPFCSASNLDEVKEKLSSQSYINREAYVDAITCNDGSFLLQLINLFSDLEDLEDLECLQKCADVWKAVIYLNDQRIVQFVLRDDIFLQMAGAMEFDSQLREQGQYRAFLTSKSRFIQVGKKMAGPLKDNVTRLFRLRFIKDEILRPSLDESGISIINSMLNTAIAEICVEVFSDIEYLVVLFDIIDPIAGLKPEVAPSAVPVNTADECVSFLRRDSLGFLRELFFLSKTLSFDKRFEIFHGMMVNARSPFFRALSAVLSDPSSTSAERIHAAEIMATLTMILPSALRQEVLEGPVPSLPPHCSRGNKVAADQTADEPLKIAAEIGDRDRNEVGRGVNIKNERCALYVVISCVHGDTDSAVIEQLGDVLKATLDIERMEKFQKDKFLTLFYDFYMPWFIVPFVGPNIPDKPHSRIGLSNMHQLVAENAVPVADTDAGATRLLDAAVPCPAAVQAPSAVATSRRIFFEVLCACVQGHTFRIKYYILRNNVLSRCLRLLESSHKHLYLGPIRLVRTVIGLKEDFYLRHIVKLDILRPIFRLFQEVGGKDCLIASVIIELCDFVRTSNVRPMIEYIWEKHGSSFENVLHVDTFDKLRLKYEQGRDTDVLEATPGCSGESDGIAEAKRQRNNKIAEMEREENYWDDLDEEDDKEDEGDSEGVSAGPTAMVGSSGSTRTSHWDSIELGQLRAMIDREPPQAAAGVVMLPKLKRAIENPLALLNSYGDDDDADDEEFEMCVAASSASLDFPTSNMNGQPLSSLERCDSNLHPSKIDMFEDDETTGISCSVASAIPADGDGFKDPPLPPLKSKFEDDDDVQFFKLGMGSGQKGLSETQSSSSSTAGARPMGFSFTMKKRQKI